MAVYSPAWVDKDYKRPPTLGVKPGDLADFQARFRRELAGQSLWNFAHVYFGHYMAQPSGQFHRNLAHWLQKALLPCGRLVGACPREHAKTTWGTIILIIWAILTGKRNIVIVGANTEEAAAKLRNVVAEIESNPLLQYDYGAALLPAKDAKGQYVSYSDKEVILACGARIGAIGIRSKIRGQIFASRRIDLLVLDDPEDDQTVESPTLRRRTLAWFLKAAINALDSRLGSIVWLGTLLHFDSCLANLIDDKDGRGWPSFKLAAYNKAGDPLWPERWGRDELAAKKKEIGSVAFSQEFMNQPIDEASQLFKPHWFRWYSPRLLKREGGRFWLPDPDILAEKGELVYRALHVFETVDPAATVDRHNCPSAYMVLGRQEVTNYYFVLEVHEEWLTFKKQLELIKDLAKRWFVMYVGIESVAYQAVLAQGAALLGLPAIEMAPIGSKHERIKASTVHVEAGRVFLPEGDEGADKFYQQAICYPAVEYVDMLDVFVYACELAMYGAPAKIDTVSRKRASFKVVKGF